MEFCTIQSSRQIVGDKKKYIDMGTVITLHTQTLFSAKYQLVLYFFRLNVFMVIFVVKITKVILLQS